MSARDWQPGDRAYVEVEVLRDCGDGDAFVELEAAGGFYVPAADLLPAPQADEGAIERVADLLRSWGVRSRHGEWTDAEAQRSAAREVIRLLASPVQPGRSEAECGCADDDPCLCDPDRLNPPARYTVRSSAQVSIAAATGDVPFPPADTTDTEGTD
ncbi:hypothetical protein [Aeromicrobium sp. HA]|uniref:hypothetical protein n=1 Tax=Aeromicrobium sp. HA TaxID=3009077 RepID=UPI0022B04922|nr:hypothetical protein [Aeromicrobium sp. HA]